MGILLFISFVVADHPYPMKKKTLFVFLSVLFQFSFNGIHAQVDSIWVDSVFRSLSPEQRIAQLLIIRAYSDRDSVYNDSLINIIRTSDVGGICFFKGSPVRQALLTNRMQQSSQTPLLISIDAEWGLGMRLDSAFSFPRQMALGAIGDDSLIYSMGRMVAKSCQRMGIHINWAPVADINNNPDNPVISFRSFGEDRQAVTRKCVLYMKGMQDEGIMAVAKHFPGHGDTDTDSHLTLPVIRHTKERMDSVELYPFRKLIREGIKGIMIAHLYLPCYDSSDHVPATLSKNVITQLLKEEMGFKGIIITDALDMQGVTKYFKPGEIEVKALMAGNDLLLLPQNTESAIQGIKQAIDSGMIAQSVIDEKCRRILQLKYNLKLNQPCRIDIANLIRDINPPEAITLRKKMVDASVTILKNEMGTIPLRGLDRRKIAALSVGDTALTLFQETLKRYMPLDLFNVPKKVPGKVSDSLCKLLNNYDILIIGIHGINSNKTDSFGITKQMAALIDTLILTDRTILVLFGTPYSLSRISHRTKPEAIVVAYQDNPVTESATGQIIFGGISASGKLPVTALPFPILSGSETDKNRLSFNTPEDLGIPHDALNIIDSIANLGIELKAYPGCQILFAKNGKIFYDKNFGHPRYDDTLKVTSNQIYDLASVTKVAATTLAIMKLYDEGKIKLDESLGNYLPELKGTNKASLRIRDVMAHQAGLQGWIPFYLSTLKNSSPNPAIYSDTPSMEFPFRVAERLYIRRDYPDTIFKRIIDSPLLPGNHYKYSDLGFYLLPEMIEKISGQPFDQYLDENFYKPLGLYSTGFRPREWAGLSMIIPTEYDTTFRKQVVWGDVNDQGAAMLGGISGHAGLFSNARDMAVVLQMILQNGSYGGRQYLSPSTIREFTRVQFPENGNRRGLGFDKPLLYYSPDGPSCDSAPPQSFGHSGFTGAYIWADPVNDLLYVFLSNRVYPSASNQKLSELNLRTQIHQAVYDILRKYHIK
ncbi:MAG: serine hydrolase [Bacteroidales bacterium]|nr:serine hydrolase [Bacteroidales bacterium]